MRIIKGKSSIIGKKTPASRSGKKAGIRSDAGGFSSSSESSSKKASTTEFSPADFYTAEEFIAELSKSNSYIGDASKAKGEKNKAVNNQSVARHPLPNKSELSFEDAESFLLPKVSDQTLDAEKTNKNTRRRSRSIQDDSDASPDSEVLDDTALLKKEYKRLMAKGVRLLSMREHSVKEISKKLSLKCESLDLVYAVIDELLANKYLSDQRFAESFVRSRQNRGYGPNKIKIELDEKGIENNLINEYLDVNSSVWYDSAEQQYSKKYGDDPVTDYKTWAKRARFMQSRGFSMEHIQVVVPAPSY